MDLDLPYLLFWAVVVSGLIIMTDLLFLKSRREKSALIGFVAEEKTGKNEKATLTQPKLVEYAYSFFPVLLLVFVLRGFVAEPYQIPSESMVPTLEVGDFILVSKYAYGLRMPVLGTKLLNVDKPKRGEMMVFVPPHDPRYFIKRVVGVPEIELGTPVKAFCKWGETSLSVCKRISRPTFWHKGYGVRRTTRCSLAFGP